MRGRAIHESGTGSAGHQLYRCRHCGRCITTRSGSALTRRVPRYRFPNEVSALVVRWYLRFRLSYADVVKWLAERGVTVDPSIVYEALRERQAKNGQ